MRPASSFLFIQLSNTREKDSLKQREEGSAVRMCQITLIMALFDENGFDRTCLKRI